MSIYGNIINENKISISEFLDYVQESDNFINSILEKMKLDLLMVFLMLNIKK